MYGTIGNLDFSWKSLFFAGNDEEHEKSSIIAVKTATEVRNTEDTVYLLRKWMSDLGNLPPILEYIES